jgi:aspartate/methionine/tyrosine aminotransferase
VNRSWSRDRALELAAASGREVVDLSLGVRPNHPPGPLLDEGAEDDEVTRYPLSAGSERLRTAAAGYLNRRFGVEVPAAAVAACAGAKEFIATVPPLLRYARQDRTLERDIALIPALGYPPYELCARLAGLRVHRMPMDDDLGIAADKIPEEVAARSLYLWLNSPANPTGTVQADPDRLMGWAREHGVIVLCDEAYAELVWQGRARTVLSNGLGGVLAVHSVSKRSNAPGLRVGFFAGDPGLVAQLLPLRRRAGLIASATSQRAAARLLDEDTHAALLYEHSRTTMSGLLDVLDRFPLRYVRPAGGLFVWVAAPGGDGVGFAYTAARRAGLVVTPGGEYGPAGRGHIRLAAAHPPAAVAERLAVLASAGLLAEASVGAASGRERSHVVE